MFRTFCDRCGGECKAQGSARFEKLTKGKAGYQLGLEVVLLNDNEIKSENHICGECIPELLISAALSYEKAKVVIDHQTTVANALNFLELKAQFEQRLAEIEIREKAAAEKQEAAEKLIAEAEKELADADERVSVLTAQLGARNTQFNAAMKIRGGAEKQLEADIKDDPEYIQSVERRERIRIGSK